MRGMTTSERGYGAVHQAIRAQFSPAVAMGRTRCARGAFCFEAEEVDGVMVGGLIRPGEPWDLGHVDGDRSRYSGPEHARCNRATASRRRRKVSRVW